MNISRNLSSHPREFRSHWIQSIRFVYFDGFVIWQSSTFHQINSSIRTLKNRTSFSWNAAIFWTLWNLIGIHIKSVNHISLFCQMNYCFIHFSCFCFPFICAPFVYLHCKSIRVVYIFSSNQHSDLSNKGKLCHSNVLSRTGRPFSHRTHNR